MPTQDINAAFSAGIEKNLQIELRQIPPTYPYVFQMETSDSKYVDMVNWETYGSPVRKEPLMPVQMGASRQSFGKRFVPDTFALGDIISKEDWEDDKYGVLHRLLPKTGGGMGMAFRTLLEVQHWGMFANLGYVSGTSVQGSPDGVSLFNTAHPISQGNSGTTASNRPSVEADLSIASYQAASTNVRTQKAANNFQYVENNVAKLVVNQSLSYIATQILKGDWEVNTADRNLNVIKSENVKLVTTPYFTKSGATGTNNSWFVQGDNHYLYSIMRSPYNVDTDFDVYVKGFVFTCDIRFAFGWADWRGVYGSLGI